MSSQISSDLILFGVNIANTRTQVGMLGMFKELIGDVIGANKAGPVSGHGKYNASGTKFGRIRAHIHHEFTNT